MSMTEPGTDVRIRPLRGADLDHVVEIETQVFSTPWRDNTFRGLLRRTDTDLLGAFRAEQLVGYAIAWTILDQSELGNVAVAPETRGLGIGRLLVESMLDRLRYRSVAEVFLEVRVSNHVAQSLYRSLGFEQVGRRRAYYNEPVEDALVMRIELGRK